MPFTGGESSSSDLSAIHDSIMQRFSPALRDSIQAQIPPSEADADSLSASASTLRTCAQLVYLPHGVSLCVLRVVSAQWP